MNNKYMMMNLFIMLILSSDNLLAELHDRGNGMIYDDVLNVTWLKDTNYAKTSGAHNSGLMSWQEANNWAENLTYGGFSDWRLPKTRPVNLLEYQLQFSFAGTTDIGYNIVSPQSELSYMFYINLKNSAGFDQRGNYTGCSANLETYCLENTAPFQNLIPAGYWSETLVPGSVNPFGLNTYVGFQAETSGVGYAWAVRDGDVVGECR